MRRPVAHPCPRRGTRRAALVALAAAPFVTAACGSSVTTATGPEETGETITVENCGRQLTFTAAPTKIVGLMPSQTELLLRLGAQDGIVGQAQVGTSDLPPDVADQAGEIPVLSTDTPPSREDLLAVSPDLVVSPTEYEFTAEQGFASIDQLTDNGAQPYVATAGCAERRNRGKVSDVFTDITNLGQILRVPGVARELSDDSRARLDAVESAIGERRRLTVAQVYVEGSTIGAIGAGVEADIIRQAGGENVFDPEAPEFEDFFASEINPEEIVERQPDAIVFGVTSPQDEVRVRRHLRKTFPDVPAVRDDLLVAVPQSDLYPGTLGNVDAVEQIAARLYPGAL